MTHNCLVRGKLKRLLAVIALVAGFYFYSAPALADCTTAGMGNQPAGKFFYNGDQKIFQYCDGTDWVAMNTPGSGSGGCTNPARAEGALVYNEEQRVLQGCAGNVWQSMGPVGGANEYIQIARNDNHTCGIRADGTLWCWGSNNQGKLGNGTTTDSFFPVQEVTKATDWTQVSAGSAHTCALKSSGTVWCWGSDSYGQLGNGATTGSQSSPVQESTGATDWAFIAAGGYSNTCAIKTDGTLWCWGNDSQGQIGNGATTGSQVSPVQEATAATDWARVSVGGYIACAVKTDGTLWCWGWDLNGMLGNGAAGAQDAPYQEATAATDWQDVSAHGGNHTCAIKTDGTVWCWGSDGSGQLGNGATTGTQQTAVQESTGATDWQSLVTGGNTSCAIKADSSVWCWGATSSGNVTSPTQEAIGSGWSVLDITSNTYCGIQSGQLKCWGDNYLGGAGTGVGGWINYPVPISDPLSWKQIDVAVYLVCGIKSDDSLWCWGDGTYGELGINSRTESYVPVQENTSSAWKQVDVGGEHVCAVRSDDTLWCWGTNWSGQTGLNTTSGDTLVPTQVNGGGTWKQVTAGYWHTCAIKSDDTIWCWGGNWSGQLGDNSTTDRWVPTAINGGGTWKQVSGGYYHTCAIKSDDTLWCWGDNYAGQLGDGTTNVTSVPVNIDGGSKWIAVSAGYEDSCGIKDDFTLWCWGGNWYGVHGDGTTNQHLVPEQVSGGGSWTQLSAYDSGDWGDPHVCAIKSDDSLWCWGSNYNGEVGDSTFVYRQVPTPVTGGGKWDMVAVAGGFSCGILQSGELRCWGDNGVGNLTNTEYSNIEYASPENVVCGAPLGEPGDVIYNASADVMQYCAGSTWIGIGK